MIINIFFIKLSNLYFMDMYTYQNFELVTSLMIHHWHLYYWSKRIFNWTHFLWNQPCVLIFFVEILSYSILLYTVIIFAWVLKQVLDIRPDQIYIVIRISIFVSPLCVLIGNKIILINYTLVQIRYMGMAILSILVVIFT